MANTGYMSAERTYIPFGVITRVSGFAYGKNINHNRIGFVNMQHHMVMIRHDGMGTYINTEQ